MGLGPRGISEWNRLAKRLFQAGILTPESRSQLVGYCLAMDAMWKAHKLIMAGTAGDLDDDARKLLKDSMKAVADFGRNLNMAPGTAAKSRTPQSPASSLADLRHGRPA